MTRFATITDLQRKMIRDTEQYLNFRLGGDVDKSLRRPGDGLSPDAKATPLRPLPLEFPGAAAWTNPSLDRAG